MRGVAVICGTQKDESVSNLLLTTMEKNKDWPGGLAHELYGALVNKYEPNTDFARTRLSDELAAINLKDGEDPNNVKLAIDVACCKTQRKVDDERKQDEMLRVLKARYGNVISALMDRLGQMPSADEMATACHNRWELDGGENQAVKKEEPVESSLTDPMFLIKNKFNSDCDH